ncbi:MAG: TIGR00730 family Rossman fold protein [Armatimonadaceae bacterium]
MEQSQQPQLDPDENSDPGGPVVLEETPRLPDSDVPLVGRPGERERKFLVGPQSRGFELGLILSIFWEFLRGFRTLHFVGPCVTVFGSARFPESHRWYQLAREIGSKLADAGFTVMTGGGPGIMEAANRGAKEAGGHSIGCNIILPFEQHANPWLDTVVDFEHFFVRKTMLIKYSYGFVAMPGGFGTFDEIFEALTLIQTKKIKDFPMVLVGKEFWEPLVEDVFRERLLKEATISPHDLDYVMVTDSADEAVEFIRQVAQRRFGLKYGKQPRKRWFLGE